MKSALRRVIAVFIASATMVSAAWAGVVLSPLDGSGGDGSRMPTEALPALANTVLPPPIALAATTSGGVDLSGLAPVTDGRFYVGADETDIAPRSPQWQTEGCSALAEGYSDGKEAERMIAMIAAGEVPPGWPRSPDCVYLGGYGIGPARPAVGVDPVNGVKVRSIAISNGEPGGTVVWQIVDMVGFFASYRSDLCTPGCGIVDIRGAIASANDIPIANIAVGSTHTHGGADGYGAWGGIPEWYRAQIRDDVVASAAKALSSLREATITTGTVSGRQFNSERRNTYWSAPDYELGWLHARTVDGSAAIATLVNLGGHPTVLGAQPLLHGDWPATAAAALGRRLGGVGLVFEGGLGNLSPSRPTNPTTDLTGDGKLDGYDDVIQLGNDLAEFTQADIARGGHALTTSTVKASTTIVEHPITNIAENGLAFAGFLDRDFVPGGPGAAVGGAWTGGKSSERPCATAGPISVRTEVSAYRVGDLTVVTGPGELFSTMTSTVKSRARTGAHEGSASMVFAQTQDALGYIIQSFEVDPIGGVLTNVTDAAEYEETFMLDRCFGDHVVQRQLDVIAALG